MNSATTADSAADILRGPTIAGKPAPGAPINQQEIAEALGVSRSPVRYAIQLLAGERLVVAKAHDTAVVAPLSLDDLQELYELRMATHHGEILGRFETMEAERAATAAG